MEPVFEKSRKGRRCVTLPPCDVPNVFADCKQKYMRAEKPLLPEISEVDLVRHYMALSRRAYGVDNGFYPLGSCTMKYNPKINDKMASLDGFTQIHPLQPDHTVQGALELLHTLKGYLCEVTGMDALTLTPAAGAHGEWTGLLMIKKYHETNGNTKRDKVLVPQSAHGTNPASATLAGFTVITVPDDEDGNVNLEELKKLVGGDTAALMLTNPNTLGQFEKNIEQIAKIIHDTGGLLYYDGANLNAIMGITRPGDMAFDVVHLNLHKTFSTPHGGGGPGAGPVGCKQFLAPFLPQPAITFENGQYCLGNYPDSIGAVKSFYGNFLVLVRAFAYITSLGADGLKTASEQAVLNANYLMEAVFDIFGQKFKTHCMHEFVLSCETLKKESGVTALDVAKAMLDYGIHPPTMYFPMIVPEALMFEPTETESIETLDMCIEALSQIYEKASAEPLNIHNVVPVTTPVSRPDEAKAARSPMIKYEFS